MYCPECGRPVADEAKFCSECGYALKPEMIPRVADTEDETPQKRQNSHEKEQGINVGILLISLLLPIVGYIIWGCTIDSHPRISRGACIGSIICTLFWVSIIVINWVENSIPV